MSLGGTVWPVPMGLALGSMTTSCSIQRMTRLLLLRRWTGWVDKFRFVNLRAAPAPAGVSRQGIAGETGAKIKGVF